MRRAAIDVALLLTLAAFVWLAHDYYIVRQRAFNGQAAAEYINSAIQKQQGQGQPAPAPSQEKK